MAASDKMFGDDLELKDGHDKRYSFFVHNLNTGLKCSFEQRFTTECQMLPTSWLFTVLFEQLPGAETVSGFITFKRTDDSKIPVKASIFFYLDRANTGSPYFSKRFKKKEILPGDEIKESIDEVLPAEHMKTTYYQRIKVTAIIIIRKCHPAIESDLLKTEDS